MNAKKIAGIIGGFVASIFLLWLCNFLWDSQYTFGAGDGSIIRAALGRKLMMNQTQKIEEILPVDISYDRELVPVSDSFGVPMGETDIADRRKLIEFLSKLKEYGNYRYILCDISFDNEHKTSSDSALYHIIATMPNIVVPGEAANLPIILRNTSASSNYKVLHHGDPFMKYHYSNGHKSIPIKMWNDLTGHDLIRHWWGYSDENGRLCNNAAVLDFTDIVGYANQTLSSKYGDLYLEEKLIYHLGADILDAGCPKEIFENKIVLIGDYFDRDMHDTAIGQVPGVMILYSAYRTLIDKKNQVPWYCYLILFIIFFVYILLLFFLDGWSINDNLIAYIIDSISFTIPLELFNYLTLLLGGFSVNAVLIGSLFGLISYVKKFPKRNEIVK